MSILKNRPAQLQLLLSRSVQQERDIAELVLENRRVEQAVRRRKTELCESRRILKVQKAVLQMSNAISEGVVKRRSTRVMS